MTAATTAHQKPIYTIEALSTGGGRAGHVRTTTGRIDTDLSVPKEMGGPGKNLPNPEELFAAGYAACFESSLLHVARERKIDPGEIAVGSRVSLHRAATGYGLAVVLEVSIPALPRDRAEDLVQAAHRICPYSNATRGNIPVTTTLAED